MGVEFFADPPAIPGLIEQLPDAESLRAEGREMAHCVSYYADAVARRASLIFRILPGKRPRISRATLEIVRGFSAQTWMRGQLKGVRNRQVSSATDELVNAWLRAVNENPQISSEQLFALCVESVEPSERRTA